ncbi:pyridoxamine 5'-phosphate oxidase family protein [Paenarthrobacter ilicis]|uniref:Nitroimidazol reductase NimA-like FMN-containing flavoprotein (Pyridoxamine 5'-phosphate oxidase superfamily) n=1 Tax=Paenarthrobacter ilicis TaxID=43665 RepID=A0ABX0THX1_9MICC|nr:pyridoxamine 5'-phosphate oxidase family protein [Paenarthrobacter ilicis]MBM7793127.1 nitroimidazol reductase NimA-like FMN-containing flavoprotein (pyridoxamine 5'-phosphate oxidase superfamily) [Paenarthrobacter ilicis]NIJ02097.1 nitroimidazol reductase NimA-like FMN-containing flavoprotein (pyridoxamine 5'-phosphate oxidase superfamily) [Paenarthrobacter ilicis]
MNAESRAAVERLHPGECWYLLNGTTVGRLAVPVDGHPEIFPVNFVLSGASIVFRSDLGTKYQSAVTDPSALEIDGYSSSTEMAWSVVVRGQSQLIVDSQEMAAADDLNLEPWQAGSKSSYLRLIPTSVTGRRFKTLRPDIWRGTVLRTVRDPSPSAIPDQ